MRKAIILSPLFFALTGGTAAAQSQIQVPVSQRYCLVESGTGALDCGFATLEQCRQTANVGREGTCMLNPALTTGSGGQDED